MEKILSEGEIQRQREITRLCIKTALLLLQHGAESTLVVQMATRLGVALGVDSVECALTTNAIMLTTLYNENCITTVRRNVDRGINMHVVTEVQHIVITAEHKIFDIYQVRRNLERVKPFKYNRYLVVVMVGLSCACFSHLAGGDWAIFGITFIASSIAMFVRQQLAMRHYNPFIVFALTAFIGSMISGLALQYQIGNTPEIALASSVLLLVPGFPLINALADILKGYINMGIGRWSLATVLTFGACIGIVFALNVLHISGWGQ
ncbi:threonine/serine ThrE exporter family protein [Phocoenobacter skyensis]|uniref:Threonine/serine exporter ThrE family protein n=1 Tax=Phocoenobacter skyensis TaxID=97481 RepID=A0A1H7VZH7_9PAST|nr:threonine/serine exporter ThrE family protein [Pasteurella skyensis]MDP8079071.1 threonine/serine exporter ThrE family protein [Pasteurella skyensis]MDP8085021.1 threonine/serine exporter ThrE family protein [Pasteurella skyensis]MDP8161930.1 threonine/serine exporter ThrE family protein [Pasteurella skyensis]MDP8170668.1 threonine/serine exporter ThrE family protein [Pasteurella skyensis]MDP8172086.1 threonine/serine exporter ThrE family protein [Pasteurella skyensis]